MRRSHILLTLALTSPLALVACSPASNTGGTGGAASGGTSSGGTSSGGTASGGTSTGGTLSTGGTASGGAGTGGATGGAGTGGATGGAGTGGATGGAGTGGAGTGGGSGEFTITSTAWDFGEAIPAGHTCGDPEGRGQMGWGAAPDLVWANPPEGTMSYAFFMIDMTLTTKQPPDVNGNHSAAWNIPTTVTSVEEGWDLTDLGGAVGINGGYLGPCPNFGGGGANTDTYHLIILAMPEASYTLSYTGTGGVRDAYAELSAEALGEAFFEGTSNASPN